MIDRTPVSWFPKKWKIFHVKFDEKSQNKNSSETMDIPSKSSKQHLDKVLTFIGLIGARYLTYSIIIQILYVWTCQVWRNFKNFQTRWKPSIILPKVVTWWSTGYDIGNFDSKCYWLIDFPFRDFPKSEKILHVRTCQFWWKITKRKTFQIHWISHSRIVNIILIISWCSFGCLVVDISHALS